MAFEIYKGGRKDPHPDETHPRIYIDDFFTPGLKFQGAVDYLTGVQYTMDLNNELGDCGIAGMNHYQMAVNYFENGNAQSWGDNVCLQLYEELGGYVQGDPSTDNGTNLQDNLGWWRHNPVNGHQILAFGQLRNTDRATRLQAMQLFGPGYIGGQLQNAQEAQFPGAWEWVPGGSFAGGHCVTYGREESGLDRGGVSSWGAAVHCNMAWASNFLAASAGGEWWGIIDGNWVKRNGTSPAGFNLAEMNSALASLTRQVNPLGLTSQF
jgi:hypothetical protein